MERKGLKQVTAFAPATVANVAVGFDILGFPLDNVGDEVTLERIEEKKIEVAPIQVRDPRLPAEWYALLPRDPERNTATIGLMALMNDLKLDFGFRVTVKKGIPMASGMGGSAASGVASLIAANHFLEAPLSRVQLLYYALMGEKFASGSAHPDNVSPCLFGGLTLTRSLDPVDIVCIPVPGHIMCLLVHPHLELDTRTARGVLKPDVPLKDYVRQSANLAGFIAGCYTDNYALLASSLRDLIIEPQRADLVPPFRNVQRAAMAEGALGCSLSGSGPSVFAWADRADRAHAIERAMTLEFERAGVKADSWMSPVSGIGARVIGES